jgi:DNA-binding NarL/FixJ family response regulator
VTWPADEAPGPTSQTVEVDAVQVLIVDDSAIVRLLLAELLESVQRVAVVGQAHGVTQAILVLQDVRPDLVILDVQMPDGDGVAVLEAAKGLRPVPAVIVLTKRVDDQQRLRCLAAGADFFLDKSNLFDEIPRILRDLIDTGVRHG